MQYQQVGVISGKGSEPKQFVEALRGICVDREGRLYAVGDREVKVFDRSGGLMRRWETELPGHCVSLRNTARTGERDRTGSVNRVSPDEPLAVDSTVFVGQPGQVEKFDAGGKSLGCWTDSQRFGLVTSISFFGDFVLLGDAEDGRWQDQPVVAWRNNKPTERVDWKALEADHPDLVDGYRKVAPGARVLRPLKALGRYVAELDATEDDETAEVQR